MHNQCSLVPILALFTFSYLVLSCVLFLHYVVSPVPVNCCSNWSSIAAVSGLGVLFIYRSSLRSDTQIVVVVIPPLYLVFSFLLILILAYV